MNDPKLNDILKEWKKESGVKSPISYKTHCPRDGVKDTLTIYTEQVFKMESVISKYMKTIYDAGIFKENLCINIKKVDHCVY